MLCIYLCSSQFSASLIQDISEIGAKQYFIDHRMVNAIQLFVPIKRTFFRSLHLQNMLQLMAIPQELLDKCSHLFICISLKQKHKPVCNVKILISEQISFAEVLYFGQVFVFCNLINKSVLEWFLLICK